MPFTFIVSEATVILNRERGALRFGIIMFICMTRTFFFFFCYVYILVTLKFRFPSSKGTVDI